MIELTIEQAKSQPQNFLYIWASDEFLAAIGKTYADKIRTKRANERLLVKLSADKFGTTQSAYEQAIRDAFIDTYKMTPAKALITLAEGGEVAGKNWSDGVYGIGSISKSFNGTDITVDTKYGYMLRDGKRLPVYDTVYDKNGKPYQQFYYDEATGRTYMSQCNKLGKWYAQSYSDSDGKQYSYSGKAITNKDSATIWANMELSLDWMQKLVDWILSLFGVNTNSEVQTLSAENTIPNQTADGFVYKSGFGEAGSILLLLTAGGVLAASGTIGGRKKKSK